MITLDLSILNQKGTPMFNSDLFANRPAAGIVGRIFISTDTQTIFRDTGTTWDTIGGGGGTIAGSIATGQVAFGTAANTIGGSSNLLWNSSLNRLSVNGSSTATYTLWNGDIFIQNDRGITAGTSLGSYPSVINRINLYNGSTGEMTITLYNTSWNLRHNANLVVDQSTILGSTTNTGERLQVNGTTKLNGTTNVVGQLFLNIPTIFPTTDDGNTVNTGSGGLFIGYQSGATYTGVTRVAIGTPPSIPLTATTGLFPLFAIVSTFAPTSGTSTLISQNIKPTINQTGGANGITRGLYVNPTLTAASDWRSIEWSNNTGWGLYGVGTANNYLRGNLLIGNATPIASNIGLQVTGLGYIQDSRAYASGTIQSFVIVRDTTINTAISSSSGICNYVSTGDSVIQSSQSVPSSTSFAGIYSFNKYSFSNPGLTLTATQAAGNGLRSVSQLQTQNVFRGANSGTITHVSGIQIAGFYNDNTGSITPVIPNAYQLIINDTGAYGHTFSFTNRWGIYQEGINDRNYLAGNLLLNSTTDTGQILQVNGAIRVNGQASGTAGGASGNHLIINVDGTQYKIALLNP